MTVYILPPKNTVNTSSNQSTKPPLTFYIIFNLSRFLGTRSFHKQIFHLQPTQSKHTHNTNQTQKHTYLAKQFK